MWYFVFLGINTQAMSEQDNNTPSPETLEILSHPPQWTEEQQKIIDQSLKDAAEKIKEALRQTEKPWPFTSQGRSGLFYSVWITLTLSRVRVCARFRIASVY